MSITPGYTPMDAFFINNLNGIYALANIRGGGYAIVSRFQLIIQWFYFESVLLKLGFVQY